MAFLLLQERFDLRIHLFADQDVSRLCVRVYGAGRDFSLLRHSLPLFKSQFDHCTPFYLVWLPPQKHKEV